MTAWSGLTLEASCTALPPLSTCTRGPSMPRITGRLAPAPKCVDCTPGSLARVSPNVALRRASRASPSSTCTGDASADCSRDQALERISTSCNVDSLPDVGFAATASAPGAATAVDAGATAVASADGVCACAAVVPIARHQQAKATPRRRLRPAPRGAFQAGSAPSGTVVDELAQGWARWIDALKTFMGNFPSALPCCNGAQRPMACMHKTVDSRSGSLRCPSGNAFHMVSSTMRTVCAQAALLLNGSDPGGRPARHARCAISRRNGPAAVQGRRNMRRSTHHPQQAQALRRLQTLQSDQKPGGRCIPGGPRASGAHQRCEARACTGAAREIVVAQHAGSHTKEASGAWPCANWSSAWQSRLPW